jgi:hypothetical protein
LLSWRFFVVGSLEGEKESFINESMRTLWDPSGFLRLLLHRGVFRNQVRHGEAYRKRHRNRDGGTDEGVPSFPTPVLLLGTSPVSNLAIASQFLTFAIYTYNLGMHSVKLGFLFQYRRIFHSKAIQTVCFWFIIFVCIWAVVQTTLSSLTCIPIAIIYPGIANTCLNTLLVWYITAGMSMATDFAIFCIPLRSVWKLQLPPKQRIMVIGIFCLGFL